MSNRCKATTKAGKVCAKNALTDCDFCHVHNKNGHEKCADITMVPSVPAVPLPGIMAGLPAQIAEVQSQIATLKAHLKQLHQLQRSQGRVFTKAKLMFYHDHKTNPQLLGDIREKLLAGGLLFTRTVASKGVVVTKEKIPYTLVREYTDNTFMTLITDAERMVYLDRALAAVLAPVAPVAPVVPMVPSVPLVPSVPAPA